MFIAIPPASMSTSGRVGTAAQRRATDRPELLRCLIVLHATLRRRPGAEAGCQKLSSLERHDHDFS